MGVVHTQIIIWNLHYSPLNSYTLSGIGATELRIRRSEDTRQPTFIVTFPYRTQPTTPMELPPVLAYTLPYTISQRRTLRLPHTAPIPTCIIRLPGSFASSRRNPTTDTYGKHPLSWTLLHLWSSKISTQRVTRTGIEPVAARLHFCAPSRYPRPGFVITVNFFLVSMEL